MAEEPQKQQHAPRSNMDILNEIFVDYFNEKSPKYVNYMSLSNFEYKHNEVCVFATSKIMEMALTKEQQSELIDMLLDTENINKMIDACYILNTETKYTNHLTKKYNDSADDYIHALTSVRKNIKLYYDNKCKKFPDDEFVKLNAKLDKAKSDLVVLANIDTVNTEPVACDLNGVIYECELQLEEHMKNSIGPLKTIYEQTLKQITKLTEDKQTPDHDEIKQNAMQQIATIFADDADITKVDGVITKMQLVSTTEATDDRIFKYLLNIMSKHCHKALIDHINNRKNKHGRVSQPIRRTILAWFGFKIDSVKNDRYTFIEDPDPLPKYYVDRDEYKHGLPPANLSL